MSVVYLHGLGQTPASWESVLRVLGQESGGLCPDLFGLIRGKEVCYENLYQAFSRYCGALPAPSPCAVCPWAGSWLCNTGSSIRTGLGPWS